VDVHGVPVLGRHLHVVLHVVKVGRAHVDRLALVRGRVQPRRDGLADHAVAWLQVDHRGLVGAP